MSIKIDIGKDVLAALQTDIASVLEGSPIARTEVHALATNGIKGVVIYVVAEQFADRCDLAIDKAFPEFERKPRGDS